MPVRRRRGARRRWLLCLALCTVVAAVAAAANASGDLVVAGATTEATIDPPRASVVADRIGAAQLESLTARTLLLGELMSTPPVIADIAQRAGVAPDLLSVSTTYLQGIPEQMLGPDLEVRGVQIIKMRAPYQLDIQPDPNVPRLEIYARAPTIPGAEQLADAAVPGLMAYLRADAISHGVDPATQVDVEQLGSARGALISSRAKDEIALLTFVIALGLCAATLLGAVGIRRGWRRAARSRRLADMPGSAAAAPLAPAATPSSLAGRARAKAAPLVDDWPHTTRILPWMMAAFLVVLWLVPFDSIQLGGSSLPVDLKFDRIVLPIIAVVWLLAVAAGGRSAPRMRLSWIHVGILGFAALACLTFVVNAHYLDQTLQLSRGVKQLILLGAYVTFFLMIASIVRPSEVPAFLRYTLVLAVLAGIGTIIEYRFQYNVFYDLAHRLLPGFQVGTAQSSSVDNLGRRLVEGPAEVPLEAVGMFTMALPIALVGITDARRWRNRILYTLAAAILLAAAVSTERKSGLLGPLGVIVTLAYFRRAQLVRIVPLALVLVVAVKVLAPGALGGISGQLAPGNLGVNTVSERVVRYDAIRPDVWLHLAVGQGFGVYSVRVLDNEYLDRLIEGGVIGLIAYVVMLLTIAFAAIGPIRRREPVVETIGIVAAAAAVGTLVLSATYDSMGFPHVPYILFSLAGLLAVALRSAGGADAMPTVPAEPSRKNPAKRRVAGSQPIPEPAWSS
ncbi:MAG: hypothetical protein ACLP50_00950 [Solirubrobacteraceae bacterium]